MEPLDPMLPALARPTPPLLQAGIIALAEAIGRALAEEDHRVQPNPLARDRVEAA